MAREQHGRRGRIRLHGQAATIVQGANRVANSRRKAATEPGRLPTDGCDTAATPARTARPEPDLMRLRMFFTHIGFAAAITGFDARMTHLDAGCADMPMHACSVLSQQHCAQYQML